MKWSGPSEGAARHLRRIPLPERAELARHFNGEGGESMESIKDLVHDYAEACRRLKRGHLPFPWTNDVSALNDVNRAQRALLRAILDENGYSDVEVVD